MSIITIPRILYPPMIARGTAYIATATLDAAEEFVAYIISVPKTGTLNKVGWYTGTVTGVDYTIKVSVETIAATVGQPVATSNATKTLYAPGAESEDITSLSKGVTLTPINGSTGVAVTRGDLVAITIRLTAITSGSVIVGRYLTTPVYGAYVVQAPYNAIYLGGSWTVSLYPPALSLEYSDGFYPVDLVTPLCTHVSNTFSSSSNPDRRGVKFKYPFKSRLSGCIIRGDFDYNCDIILYDSDEYTVASGFPLSLNASQRRSTDEGEWIIEFPTKFEASADTWYRLVVLPTTTSNISFLRSTVTSDGSFDGMESFQEGASSVYTSFNGEPTSGDHAWTDSTTDKAGITLLIDGIEASSGGSGGISRSRQLMG